MPALEGQGNRPSTRHHRHQALHQRPQNNHGSHHRNLIRQTLFSLSKDLEGNSGWFTESFEQVALQNYRPTRSHEEVYV